MLEVLKGNEHAVAYNGKYNLGQKMLFWTLNLAMVTLLVTGIIMWRQFFSHYFSIPVLRFAIFTSLFKCIHVVHRYLGTHVHGILGKRLHSWYRGRLGNRSLGEKNTTRNGITKKYFLS